MKKVFPINILAMLALLSCIVCLYYSCKFDHTDCSSCQMTLQEEALLPAYNKDDIVVFKNDTTGVFDTLHVTSKGKNLSTCEDPCSDTYSSMSIWCLFLHNNFIIGVGHSLTPVNRMPGIGISNGYSISFLGRGTIPSITINNISYNDIYIYTIDSTTIPVNPPDLGNTVPWKTYYSKSKGFVRFYMINGQTWSKL